MIFPDVNILLYAHDSESEFYESASGWFKQVMSSEQVYFSWHTLTAFLRISTNPRVWVQPLKIDQAIRIIDSWLARENTHIVALEKRNWPLFVNMLTEGQAKGSLVMDAHLAAMAAACGAKLASTDRDFTRFPNIQVINPLKP